MPVPLAGGEPVKERGNSITMRKKIKCHGESSAVKGTTEEEKEGQLLKADAQKANK